MLRDRIIIYEFHEDTDQYEPDYMFTPDQVTELLKEMEERRKEEMERDKGLFETLGDMFRPEQP